MGSFDGNMVCHLPGSWVNHVAGLGMLGKALEGTGRLCEAFGGFGCFGRFWEALAASVRLCKALVQWMLWKVLEASGVLEMYGRLFERFSEALKGFGKL